MSQPKPVQESELKDFERSHEIVIDGDRKLKIIKVMEEEPAQKACVYVWASKHEDSDDLEILYVGKAGYGIEYRLKQHSSAFRNHKPGKKNYDELKEIIDQGHKVSIYFWESAEIELFGFDVSLCSAEENALWLALKPKWNKAGFPHVHFASPGEQKKLFKKLESAFSELSEFDRGELNNYLESSPKKTIDTFGDLIDYAHKYLAKGLSCKMVRGNAGMPEGCNSIPVIVYAQSFDRNNRAKGWVVRITLAEEPRIIFRTDRLKKTSAIRKKVDMSKDDKVFSPRKSKEFLKAPRVFVKE